MSTPVFEQASALPVAPRVNTEQPSKNMDMQDLESGYVSATDAATDTASSTSSSTASLPRITLTRAHLNHLNDQLEEMSSIDILRFCKVMFPNLFQTTAFGLTGLVTIDMLSKIQADSPSSAPVDLIFLDTLYHFQETHDLVNRVRERYPNVKLHVYKPYGVETTEAFEQMYGERMYETAAEMYDWTAKVEPQQRAYDELKVAAVLTGRRRSQGAARDKLPIIEVDEERGVIKINPLARWNFQQVREYIDQHQVPYNVLLDRGYKSIGDWHSTSAVREGEDERAGRWRGQQKTECGIHNKKSRYAQFLEKMAQQEALEAASAALEKQVPQSQEEQQQQQPQQVI